MEDGDKDADGVSRKRTLESANVPSSAEARERGCQSKGNCQCPPQFELAREKHTPHHCHFTLPYNLGSRGYGLMELKLFTLNVKSLFKKRQLLTNLIHLLFGCGKCSGGKLREQSPVYCLYFPQTGLLVCSARNKTQRTHPAGLLGKKESKPD